MVGKKCSSYAWNYHWGRSNCWRWCRCNKRCSAIYGSWWGSGQDDQIKKMKLNFAHLVAFFAMAMAFFLPLHIGLSNLFLILFFVGSGYFLFIKKEHVKRKPSLLIYTLLPFFLLYVIGVFYSEPPFIGTKVMGRTIAFLLCPLLLLFYPKSVLQRVKSGLFKGIVAGSIISVGYLLINNFLNYFATRPFLKFDDEILCYYYTYHYF